MFTFYALARVFPDLRFQLKRGKSLLCDLSNPEKKRHLELKRFEQSQHILKLNLFLVTFLQHYKTHF